MSSAVSSPLRFFHLLASEMLKTRKTSALLISLVLPYTACLALFLFAAFDGERLARSFGPDPGGAWRWLVDSAAGLWSFLFWPLFVGLAAALQGALEHRARGFQRLFALPVSSTLLLWAKLVTLWLLVALAHATIALGTLTSGLMLRWVEPGLGFEAAIPWWEVLTYGVGATGAALFGSSLCFWIATWRRDFAAPLVVSLLAFATLAALAAVSAESLSYHPWSYPFLTGQALGADDFWRWPILGTLSGLVFGGIACFSLARQEIS